MVSDKISLSALNIFSLKSQSMLYFSTRYKGLFLRSWGFALFSDLFVNLFFIHK